jgi:hypothetical protein
MNDPRWLDDARDPGRSALREALDEQPRFRASDVRRRRVWSRMEGAGSALRATRQGFVAGAVAASACAAIVALVAQHLPRRRPAPAAVTVTLPAARPAAASSSTTTPPPVVASPLLEAPPFAATGAVVTAAPGERAARRLAGGVRANLQPGAALSVEGEAQAEVRHGETRFDVPDRESGPPFVVRVGAYRVIIAGARIRVRVDDAGGVTVAVDDGAADVWRRRRIAQLGPGDSWSAPPRAGRALASASAGRTSPADGADRTAAGEAAGRDPARAVRLYEQIAARGGSASQNALYEIGVLYHDRLHDPERALSAWERYRTRYPQGWLRAEADLSILDTLAAMGRRSRALDEALAFLKRNPGSERRGEVARVGADLARGLGQCRVAADLYAEVAGAHISADDADDAAFGRAACLAAVSDPRAPAVARAYVAAHPRGRHLAEARRLVESAGRAP